MLTCKQCGKPIGRLDGDKAAMEQFNKLLVSHRDEGKCSVWNDIVADYNKAMTKELKKSVAKVNVDAALMALAHEPDTQPQEAM